MTSQKIRVTSVLHKQEVEAGWLFINSGRGVFHYSADYLKMPNAFTLAPSLPLVAGALPLDGLGGFSDSAPDRWGRKILQRARKRTSLSEFDYLLGVNDFGRQGATRFWSADGQALASGDGVPAEVDLPDLLNTADAVEKNLDVPEVQTRRLFRATGSLGGARPKANVLVSGELYLAKFPKPLGDDWDVMGWEAVMLDMQAQLGIEVPEHRLVSINDAQGEARHVLLMRRFDRDRAGQRVPYMSALTALEAQDGEGGDYLDLVEWMRLEGADAQELWRRAVFGALVGNTDNHLRNHGFLRWNGHWSLAPSFDVNPTPDGRNFQLSLWGSDEYGVEDFLRRDTLELFGVSQQDAETWLGQAKELFTKPLGLITRGQVDAYSLETMKKRFTDFGL